MTVRKRIEGLDANYYISGNTVRRNAQPYSRREPTTATRRTVDSRSQLFTSNSAAAQQTHPQTQRRTVRYTQPVRDTRSQQERRRADPPRAYYAAAQPATQRLTRQEVNHRTVQQHARQRAEQEVMRRQQQMREQADAEAEARRRHQHRVQTLFAFIGIFVVVGIASGIFTLLVRYTNIEQMIVQQRVLTAEIEDQQKRLEELQVEINMQGNISQIQDYAHDQLNMDYAQKENTRMISLP